MIIGVTGPAGAGKDTTANYIAEKLHVRHVSGGDLIRLMLTKLNLEPNKSAVGDFGTFLKTHYGAAILVDKAIEVAADDKHVVFSGFRAVEVANLIKERGGIVCYIDSDDSLRHDRIISRQRSLDDTSLDALKALDQREKQTDKPMAENLESVKKVADVTIHNDGSLQDLYAAVDKEVAERFKL